MSSKRQRFFITVTSAFCQRNFDDERQAARERYLLGRTAVPQQGARYPLPLETKIIRIMPNVTSSTRVKKIIEGKLI
jgi:hypothetical protein